MKIGNFRIGTRLTIGFLVVILSTAAVGGTALHQMSILAGLINEMYDHPLSVGYAVRDIRSEIDQMHDQVQRLLFASDPAVMDAVQQDIDQAAERVGKKFDLVKERFLGNKDDVLAAQTGFTEWKAVLDREFDALRAQGNQKLSRDFYMAHLKRTERLQEKLQVMINFASGKAQSFLKMAHEEESRTRSTMIVLSVATLALSLGIAWLITWSITPSLQLIVRRMKDIARGDLRHDVEIDQKDEIGVLADSFREIQTGLREKVEVAMAIASGDLNQQVAVNGSNDHLGNALNQMTLALQDSKRRSDLQDWGKSGKNELNHIIAGQADLKLLANDMLSFLARYLGAQVGTLYVTSGEGTLLLHGSYAVSRDKGASPAIAAGEGLLGQAALQKEIITFSDIPPDYLSISSSLGTSSPRHITALPLLFEDQLMGVIELGSLKPFSDVELNFLRDTSDAVAIAVHTVDIQAKRKQLLEQTQQQARQLQVQEEELRVSNEELEEQTRSLRKSEEQLKQQQEELTAINEELEEKNQYLEEQKGQIDQKNRDLEIARQELELRARQLEVTSKYKSEFLANMSHELRTPLNSLLLLSGDLQENAAGNLSPEQVESAGVIHKGGMELLQLINEVLDLSKIEAGRMDLKIEAVDLKEIAQSIEQRFNPMAAQKGLHLEINIADDLPPAIKTDEQRLGQILNNLISNALKFTEQGSVTVDIRRPDAGAEPLKSDMKPDDWVAFCVTDTGIGIASDHQMQIFEAFQQVDGSAARKYGGTGLGLSIARELANLLGGRIRLTSAPAQGSTFTLFLPRQFINPSNTPVPDGTTFVARQLHDRERLPTERRVDTELTAQIESIADDRHRLRAGDRSILIIEDDPEFARILLNQCHAIGFKGLVSASGEEGLALAEKILPEAIMLDIRLPGISGCTVLNSLKKNPATRHIPVHIISVEEQALETLQRGAIGFTTKPVDRERLTEAFESIEQVVTKKIKDLLIVEDSADQRMGIVKLIGDADLNIVEVENGAAAMSALKERNFDCMILDLGLPDMTGFDLLNRMSAERHLDMPPVIVYTGKELTREEEMELRKHAESIIIKGVKSEERLLDEVSLFLHKTVSSMPPARREMIISLHERDSLLSGRTILLVDDDMRNLFALSKILTEKGLNVLKAEDGRKALTLLEAHPDTALVLLDIMMPVMDGYETTRRIRQQPRFHDLPIIALTAKALKEDRNKCIAAGANDYLSKPVDIERLTSLLRVWLYRRECVI